MATSAPESGCPCGIVVLRSDELDEAGLCVVCGGSGHEWACACIECSDYFVGTDRGDGPAEALAAALRSAATKA